jgi:formamidopyrimidine-DNA glycosylase
MPELPDVEGFRRYLERHATGQRIDRIEVPGPPIVRNRTPQTLARTARGNRFATPARHGKWLLAPLAGDLRSRAADPETDGPMLLLHFGMTGLAGVSRRPRKTLTPQGWRRKRRPDAVL